MVRSLSRFRRARRRRPFANRPATLENLETRTLLSATPNVTLWQVSDTFANDGNADQLSVVRSGDQLQLLVNDQLVHTTSFASVEALLIEAGSSKAHMLQAIVWLAQMSDYDAMNAVWDAWVPEGHAPARACGEARLAGPDLLVEVIVTAARREGNDT